MGIEVGKWVRLFAQQPNGRGRRRLLQEEPRMQQPEQPGPERRQRALLQGKPLAQEQPAPPQRKQAGPRPLGNQTTAAAVGIKGGGGSLPLPAAFIEGRRQAIELGLGMPEHAEGGVQAADADGTLNSYLYGNNAADSGPREWCTATACWGDAGFARQAVLGSAAVPDEFPRLCLRLLPAGPFRGERIRFASRCAVWQILLPCHRVRPAPPPGSSRQPTSAAWHCRRCRALLQSVKSGRGLD